MTTYRIRGQVQKTNQNPSVLPDVWVEVWDKDERFDDRLGRSKTDSAGVFEIEFSDPDFQQEPLELEWEPDLFFKVYQGRQLLFNTAIPVIRNDTPPGARAENNIQWNWDKWTTSLSESENPLLSINATDGTNTYQIKILNAGKIEEQPDFQPTIPMTDELWENNVIDILPTLDQVQGSGIPTALSPYESRDRGGSLQQIVDSALSEVLCQTPKDDPKAFLTSLNKAFTPQESNGRTTYNWTPCAYTSVQTELGGAVSGAQASLYHRAKVALNEMLPLLDRLYPLDPSSDRQNLEAARSIVRTEITELVNELGVQGGPRAQRVDSLFQLLIGNVDANDPYEKVGGQLRDLADIFGLARSRVNTVDEEQNYGNYLIIRDYLISLRASWKTYIEDSGAGAFLGSQLILLSQALSVVAESVQEVYRIMDLVFLGPAERQSVWIDFTKAKDPKLPDKPEVAFLLPDGKPYSIERIAQLVPAMTIEGLLSWVMGFATKEGLALAQAGGKIGIAKSLAEIADRLMILVLAASFVPVRNSAFRRAGVMRALKDLAFQLYQVKRLAQELIPPLTSYRILDSHDGRDELRRPQLRVGTPVFPDIR